MSRIFVLAKCQGRRPQKVGRCRKYQADWCNVVKPKTSIIPKLARNGMTCILWTKIFPRILRLTTNSAGHGIVYFISWPFKLDKSKSKMESKLQSMFQHQSYGNAIPRAFCRSSPQRPVVWWPHPCHIQVQRRSGLPWPLPSISIIFSWWHRQHQTFFASQRHSSLCPIQQNIAEQPGRAEAEAMCDQKKNIAFDGFGETLFMMADN